MKEPSAHDVRQAILELASDAASRGKGKADLLDLRFVHNARKSWSQFAMGDSSGREVTYGAALTGSMLVAGWVRRRRSGDEMMGVLLPPSIGGSLANIGITLAGKVPVNLNFTAGREAMASAIEQCRIRTIVTSKVFLSKAKIEPMDGMVFIEDILAEAGWVQKLWALLRARLEPAWMLRGSRTPDTLATIIFSSGSTGVPKGVMLSHHNVLSNVDAIAQVFWIGRDDRIIGVLPFFHSFGFTVTVWFPLVAGFGVAYHPNPIDAKSIGALVAKYKGTFLLSTPTFCAHYTRKCSKEELASLRYVMVGAEKLRDTVAQAFQEKFELPLLEGYGCTELSPVACVNTPNFEAGADSQTGAKPGTVGRPLPGVAVQVVDPDTMLPLLPDQPGLLLVKGPNRMLGYLGQPERTKDVTRGDWYVTGDIAAIDDEGFVRITDRLSRFSKIGGEMVPHLKVEQAIYGIIGEHACAVIGVPDEQRGERLVALYTRADMPPDEVWKQLSETDLPKLWLPKRENFYHVDSLPVLGSGKLDLRGLRVKAEQLTEVAKT